MQLDAKKSPLALLAQTCSSIGKDTNPSKPIIPPIEKAKDSGNSKSESPSSVKSVGTDGRKSSPNTEKREDSPNGDKSFRTPAPKDIPPLVPISSGSGDKSPRGTPESSAAKTSESSSSTSSSATAHSSSKISLSCGNVLLEVSHSESATATSVPKSTTSVTSSAYSLSGSLKPEGLLTPASGSLPPSLAPYPGCGLPFLPHHLPLDASSSAYHASLAAHSALASQKLGGLPGTPLTGTSPYVAYAHVKTAAGATTLVPICRDPYCTNCQLQLQSTQLSRCGAGCTQCNHEKTLSSSSLSASGLPLLPPSASSSLPSVSGASPYLGYPHSLGLLAGHHGLPYVCNWMSGSDYCGKRFNTSEELLQHLRTHTSSSETAALAAAMPPYSLGLPTPGAALGCHSHYSSSGSLSPNSLRSSYQRSLSPNSLLAASRYHPYKPTLSSLPTPPSLPSLPAGLPPYYSPYALYGQRLGAAVGP